MPSPSPGGSGTNGLFAVSASSAGSAWAVGSHATDIGSSQGLLADHRNGTSWLPARGPGGRASGDTFFGIATATPADAWAVGNGHDHIARWDGASWKAVFSPSPAGASYFTLFGVAVVAPDSAWAVGDVVYKHHNIGHTLIERWDGATGRSWQAPARS